MSEDSERLKSLLFTLGETNDPHWEEAYKAFMREDIVISRPILLQLLWDQGSKDPNWGFNVEGWCKMLRISNIAEQFAPTLVGLLYIQLNYRFDPSVIMDVFEKLGVTNYPYIIPALIQIVRYKWHPIVVEQAWTLLHAFGTEELQPYQDILASLANKKKE